MAIFSPTLFMSIGENSHFYTLRCTEEVVFYNSNGRNAYISSYHICNLSQDYDSAVSKIIEYSRNLGIPYKLSNDLERDLKEIQRRNAEQIETARIQAESDRIALITEKKQELLAMLESGIMPIGYHKGENIDSIPHEYFDWFVNKSGFLDVEINDSHFNKMHFVASWIKDNVEIIVADFSNSEYQGNIGDKRESQLWVTKAIKLSSLYGISTLYIMHDANNNVFTWNSTNNTKLEKGESYKLKFTVKAHREYEGIKQTVITRAKVI